MHLDPTGLELGLYHGTLALLGPSLDSYRSDICPIPHITLLSPAEYKEAGRPDPRSIKIPLAHVYALGEGQSKDGGRWAVVVWNHADVWRRKLGLERKQYHITLSGPNIHDTNRGLRSLQASVESTAGSVKRLGLEGMDHVALASEGFPDLVSAVAFCLRMLISTALWCSWLIAVSMYIREHDRNPSRKL